jgi:ATP-dependent helicase HrpA
VVASEQVSLFGLIIVPQRPVSYGRINPDEASEIFIQSALVEGDVKKKFDFMLHNQSLIDEVKDMEDRIRRRDLLISEVELFEFYRKRLKGCYDIRALGKRLKQKGSDHFLRMKPEDIRRYCPDDEELSLFPDKIDFGNQSFDCAYSFDPGKNDDGVTVKIPSSFAPIVPLESIDWLVPGLFREKITALIKSLPKAYRRQLVPVANTVDVIINEMPKAKGSLITALGNFIFSRFGIDIPASAWPDHLLPDHLKMRISITDPKGEELYSSRDPAILRRNNSGKADEDESDEIESARKKWEKTGMTSWDFPDLPEIISIKGKKSTKWLVYPGLEIGDQDNKSVNLRLFRRQDQAIQSHKDGVAMLFSIYFSKDLKFLKKALTIPKKLGKMADYFGGAARFGERLYKSIIKDLFCKNIRSKNAFYSHAESIAPVILSNGRELMNKSMKVLEAYHETRSIFFHLETENKASAVAIELLKGLREELASLVPETFMDIYDMERFVHLVRYIKALAIRAQRALVNFEKDRTKAEEIRFFTDSLNVLLKRLSPDASEEKRAAVEEYFWLIEEYKVSVFAQELKTPVRVSKKRLERKLKEIERII